MALRLQVVSDFVCPYCYLLEALFRQVQEEMDLEIEYLPFELTERPAPSPDICGDSARRERYERQLAPICWEIGLDMKLPPRVSPRPYTDLAFCGWYHAKECGLGDAYHARVFRAYFEEERDIGDVNVLTALAAEVGLEPEAFHKALEQPAYIQQVRSAVCRVRETVRPQVVPTVLAGEKRLEGFVRSTEELKAWLYEIM